jgi:4'-phosphopantetheinyl transferase
MKEASQKRVYCLSQCRHELPADESWLSSGEAKVLAGLDFQKRRRDWLLGRWTVKVALNRFHVAPDRPLRSWQIVAATDGAPMIRKDGHRTNIPVSLSHSGSRAMCVLAKDSMRLGCDLEKVEKRSRSFEETFFNTAELAMLDQRKSGDHARLVTLIWSAKESALKALRTGLKADTRRVEVKSCSSSDSGAWNRLEVEDTLDSSLFHGWWRAHDGMVMTVLSDQEIDQPTEL